MRWIHSSQPQFKKREGTPCTNTPLHLKDLHMELIWDGHSEIVAHVGAIPVIWPGKGIWSDWEQH